MTRFVVLLAIGVGAVALGTLACGGNDKPPLTPDSTDTPSLDATEAGAPTTPPAK
jgi:hypothetical protein